MENCKSFYLWVEDTYGPPFFERLIERIEEELGIKIPPKIPQYKYRRIKSTHGIGDIESKINNIVTRSWIKYDCVIIVCDGDRTKGAARYEKLNKKILEIKRKPEDKNKKVIIIVLNKAIEYDWAEKGNCKGIDYRDKAELPNYAERIDLNILKKEDNNFRKFISAIDP